jgi:hypothetical protein
MRDLNKTMAHIERGLFHGLERERKAALPKPLLKEKTPKPSVRVWRAPAECSVILTNPPYKLAAQFAEHALTLVPDVYLLLRLAFLESAGRTELLEHSGLRRVLVFRKRLPRMHRSSWTGPKASSSMCFAWMCWRRGFTGPTILSRI